MTKRLSIFLALVILVVQATATTTDSLRVYTEENPLVYEDVWDLWPYSFLNDNGEPDGYNVDLVKLMMAELNIPYVIKMKQSEEAFNDLKTGKSDLMLGLAVGFHDEYGLYSKNAVTLFTQSVLTPKNKPVQIKTFRDLGKPGMKVIVNYSSMCYHLMIDYGWEKNAIPERDIREVIQRMSAREEGQMVWNTLTLKWLMHRYLIDNLELTPVNMPHGEYKFMSNDQHLLDILDEELTKLNTAEKLKPLQDKWFYPERQPEGTPQWVIYVLAAAGVLFLIMLVYLISYRLQNYRLTRHNDQHNRRLALILQTSHVRIWTYDINANEFSWRNENGQVAYTYSMEEFSQRYSEEDFMTLKAALSELSDYMKKPGEEEKEVSLSLRAKDEEGGDGEVRDYVVVLSVMHRDKNGKPTIIIGTKKDVTRARDRKRLDDERTLRYWSLFYTPVVGILLFDRNGILVNINPKACEIYQCEEDEIIDEKRSIRDFIDIGNITLEETDGYYASQLMDFGRDEERRVKSMRRSARLYCEQRLATVYDDSHELLGVFAIIREISDSVCAMEHHAVARTQLDSVMTVLHEYNANIDSVLHESDVRLATYLPSTHTLTIHRSVNEVQHALTQTRCMTLVNDQSKKQAMRLLNDMDGCLDKEVKADIHTTLRIKGGLQLRVQIYLMPLHDKNGNVVQYMGLLRDLSELRGLEQQLKVQTAKVQEVENTKNSFIKNVVQEIRVPMNKVIDYVGQFNPEAPSDNEAQLSEGILENADYLLHLIDNILYLSRLQARMVEIVKQPRNFAEMFENQCVTGWERFQNAYTRYIVENPYEQLVVDIDAENLGRAIGQIAANAAQHTKSGIVRARYDYIGRRLMISLDDTGEGMAPEVLQRINAKEPDSMPSTKGLGIAIAKELLNQMGGSIEFSSELGSGTTVYITIPCHASVIKRKKLA